MTLRDELNKLETNLSNCYTSCNSKGATIPQNQNFDNLATCIDSITTGGVTGYKVRVYDYDGTIISQGTYNTGDIVTLPQVPTHSKLTFNGWVCPFTITNNTVTVADSDIDVGATYYTTSGLNEFDIELTEETGLTVYFGVLTSKDWGDGTTDSLTSHTYSDYGSYTISTNSASNNIFGQLSNTPNESCVAIRLGLNTGGTYLNMAAYCSNLKSIVIGNSSQLAGSGLVSSCPQLKCIIFPVGTTSITGNTADYDYQLEKVVIPSTTTAIRSSAFRNCKSLKEVIFPQNIEFNGSFEYSGITNIPYGKGGSNISFRECASLGSVNLTDVSTFVTYAFQNCYTLKSVTLSGNVTGFTPYCFQGCRNLEDVTIPTNIQTLSNGCFQNCSNLKSIYIPPSVALIETNAFDGCYLIEQYDFSDHLSVPTLSSSNAFSALKPYSKIKVPFDLYQSWITSSNWASISNYIDGGVPANITFSVTPQGVIYVNGKLINGNTTQWVGSSLPYTIFDNINNVLLFDTKTGITEGSSVAINADLSTYNKISINTGVSGLSNVFFSADGVNFSAIDENNGNYYINATNNSGTLYYNIADNGYLNESGSITLTGSTVTENVTLTPAVIQNWTRPDLTANGTIGGSSFATLGIGLSNSLNTYKVFNASLTDYVTINNGQALVIYNPTDINITQIVSTCLYGLYVTDFNFYGSSDGNSWKQITATRSSSAVNYGYTWTLNNSEYYKYYKFQVSELSSTSDAYLADLAITATEKVAA